MTIVDVGEWEGRPYYGLGVFAYELLTGELYEAYANYDLGRALVELSRCDEALPHLDRSEQIQGSRHEVRDARAKCA